VTDTHSAPREEGSRICSISQLLFHGTERLVVEECYVSIKDGWARLTYQKQSFTGEDWMRLIPTSAALIEALGAGS
jgi:hypothetical protein